MITFMSRNSSILYSNQIIMYEDQFMTINDVVKLEHRNEPTMWSFEFEAHAKTTESSVFCFSGMVVSPSFIFDNTL